MKKKISEFTKRKRNLEDCTEYIDPTRCTTGRFELVEAALSSPRFNDPDSPEFKASKRAIQYLLAKAIVLNEQPFWDSLEYSSHMPDVSEPEDSDRDRKLRRALDRLELGNADHRDLDWAISVLANAVTSMHTQFLCGEVTDGFEGVPSEMRYMCAAMLGAMSAGLAKVRQSRLSRESS